MTSTPPLALATPVELPPCGGGAGSLPAPGQPERERAPEPSRKPEPGAEEWAIHDFAGFEGARVEEYASFDTVAELAEFIAERGELGAKLLEHYGGDLSDARERFEEYRGAFESVADYARELVEDCGPKVPAALRHYIDWESMGRDMAINGDILTIEAGHRSVHVFGGQ